MLRLVGDVHAQVDKYIEIIKDVEWSIQLGDFGFKRHYENLKHRLELHGLSPKAHRFVSGNHDDCDHLPPSALPDFGSEQIGEIKFGWIRGAFSIDYHLRQEGVNWWRNEELTYMEADAAIEYYIAHKPAVMLSHDCPGMLLPHFATKSMTPMPGRTNQYLDVCWEKHRPRLWVFGHHHHNLYAWKGGTLFVCLGSLQYLDLDESLPNYVEPIIERMLQCKSPFESFRNVS